MMSITFVQDTPTEDPYRPAHDHVSFFELGVEDAEKARTFYGAMFGEFETGPAMQGYAIKTAGVPGGMHPGDKGAWPYVFFEVKDLDAEKKKRR